MEKETAHYLLLVIGDAAYFIVSSRKLYEDKEDAAADNAIEVDTLIRQLVALDTDYESGRIEEVAHQD